ncbi:hypothetical protein B0A49_06685 [Cryomyces minteri]|uniref:Mid2 domain-containing protein n=1 Tax=Cryomyces minteri TaxID=331657 RepID=A0A4U0XDQ8_9PEZI|nr:hypothetical protein B0A49_06685 [Cryomyces minteri]
MATSLYVLQAAGITEPRCYYPDGSLDTDGYVCNVTAAAQRGGAGACWPPMSGAIWIQSCSVQNKTACCLTTDFGTGSCCNNSTFQWTPGYIVAVINGDGTNRLGPYVDVNGSTQGGTTATTSQTLSSPTATTTTAGSTTASAGGISSPTSSSFTPSPTSSSSLSTSSATARTVGLAVGIPVGLIALAAITALIIFMRRFKQEKIERKEMEEKMTRSELEHVAARHGSPPQYPPQSPPQEMPGREVAAAEMWGSDTPK